MRAFLRYVFPLTVSVFPGFITKPRQPSKRSILDLVDWAPLTRFRVYWIYHTPRSTGVLYSSSWLQTWFKYSNMKLSFVSGPDDTLILCISSLSPADKNHYKRWWSICHSTSGLKYQKMGKCTSKMPQLFMSWGIRNIHAKTINSTKGNHLP